MADPVLTAALSGQRAILLSWTFDSNADFQVFWKSSVPAGQEYALLSTTNAFSFTTADLEPSKTYYFYVRANVGALFYYSNTVELFVSCGKGVVLSSTPPVSPPAQVFDGDFYACVAGGDIYKMTGSTGAFVALNQATKLWYGITVAPNGDVYAAVPGDDIYKQTGGVGDFIGTNTVSDIYSITQMTTDQYGNIYYITFNGAGAFKQTAGSGSWVNIGMGGHFCLGIAVTPSGDVYVSKHPGDIYKQTGGVGSFAALGQPSRNYTGLAAARNGDVYVCTSIEGAFTTSAIYKQSGGVGDFVDVSASSFNWLGMASSPNGDIYACVQGGDIYKRTRGVGLFVPLGLPSRNYYDIACGPNTAGIIGG